MPVRVVGRDQVKERIDGKVRLKDIMKTMDLMEDQYISLVNGSPSSEDAYVTDSDDVVFLEVFSGG